MRLALFLSLSQSVGHRRAGKVIRQAEGEDEEEAEEEKVENESIGKVE